MTAAAPESYWAHVDLSQVPHMPVPAPGPQSRAVHARCTKYFKGLSSQVKLFPVVFESGHGCTLRDADGNVYIDFSSGIYVTTLGHCHPKVTEAVQRYAARLMNAHDFTTEIKTRLLEKLAEVLPGDLNGFQLYDCGTAAVEAGLRVCRAATGKWEIISCFNDFHGKTYGAVSLSEFKSSVYGPVRAPGMHMAPRPDPYRPHWTKPDGTIDTDRYIQFYEEYLARGTASQTAAFVLEPIQGWGGSIIPPDDFFPKLRKLCDKHKVLLMADEVLTSWARTGQWLCLEHWNVVPDVVTIGKGFGNGFQSLAWRCVSLTRNHSRRSRLRPATAGTRWPAPPLWPARRSSRRKISSNVRRIWANWRSSGCARCSAITKSSAMFAPRAA